MAIGNAVGSAAGERAAGYLAAGVVNQDLRPARQHARAGVVPAPVQRRMPDWMSFLPEATRANAHLLTIWPALDCVEDDETE